MSRRARKPVQSAPVQPGPPQASPLAGEFPPAPMGMMGAPVGNAPPAPGMHKAKVSKSKGKGKFSKGK